MIPDHTVALRKGKEGEIPKENFRAVKPLIKLIKTSIGSFSWNFLRRQIGPDYEPQDGRVFKKAF